MNQIEELIEATLYACHNIEKKMFIQTSRISITSDVFSLIETLFGNVLKDYASSTGSVPIHQNTLFGS